MSNCPEKYTTLDAKILRASQLLTLKFHTAELNCQARAVMHTLAEGT
jgi:hypothetical protein